MECPVCLQPVSEGQRMHGCTCTTPWTACADCVQALRRMPVVRCPVCRHEEVSTQFVLLLVFVFAVMVLVVLRRQFFRTV